MPVMTGADGNLIEYEVFDFTGPRPDATAPVVVVPGLGCTWRVWNPQIPALLRRRRVIAVNCRGSGASAPVGPGFSIADLAADIHELLSHLGVDDAVLVGISMGGAVVLEYALEFPDSLTGLVVVGSAAGAPDQMRATLDSQQTFIESHDMREIAVSRMTAAFGPGADSGIRRWMVEMIAANDVGGYRSQAAAAFAFDVRDRLGDLAAPAAILHGSDDRVLPVALAHDLLGRISDSSLQVLDGLGHFANLEDPNRFNAVLLSAVSGLHR